MLTLLCRVEFIEVTLKTAFSILSKLVLKEKTIGVALAWCVFFSTFYDGGGVGS